MATSFDILTEQNHQEIPLGGEDLLTIMLEQVTRVQTTSPLLTALTLELGPGSAGSPAHLHPGPIVGYVLEGELAFQCHGTERVVYKAGDVFWEPGIDLPHVLTANPNPGQRTRLFAVCVGVPGEPVVKYIDQTD